MGASLLNELEAVLAQDAATASEEGPSGTLERQLLDLGLGDLLEVRAGAGFVEVELKGFAEVLAGLVGAGAVAGYVDVEALGDECVVLAEITTCKLRCAMAVLLFRSLPRRTRKILTCAARLHGGNSV